jgi:CheY-like chemotaxis protein
MVGNVNAPRVLFVEDDKDVQVPISQILELLGYEVACADNGQAGVDKAENWRPDVILMDVRMPVMDGPEAIRALRSKSDTESIPVFVLSAFTDAKTRASCKEAGADGFFAKPLDIDKVHAAIKKTLAQRTNRPLAN